MSPSPIHVADAHAIAHQVKDAVRAALPQVRDVQIHMEPYQPTEVTEAT